MGYIETKEELEKELKEVQELQEYNDPEDSVCELVITADGKSKLIDISNKTAASILSQREELLKWKIGVYERLLNK